MTKPLSYADSGVSIDAGDELVERIKPLAKKTLIPGVLGSIGGFGAMFEVSKDYKEPVLVTGTDGVGTKLKLAFLLNKHDSVGQDLVGMSVNDILVQGAKPLFFLDYFACGHLDVDVAEKVVGGVARGCELAGCALIGGETAEMPGMYPEGEYDLAGFAVGVVDKANIIDGKSIVPGDVVLGLTSSGPHSNGFSLIRKVIEVSGASWEEKIGDKTLADAVMEPTRIYVKPVLSVMEKWKLKEWPTLPEAVCWKTFPEFFLTIHRQLSKPVHGRARKSSIGFKKKAISRIMKCTAYSITVSVWPLLLRLTKPKKL